MFQKVDCIRINVPDLESALEFYRDKLGLELVWRRSESEAGLKMRRSDTELVLVTERIEGAEIDFLVESADMGAKEFERLGGKVIVSPFDIAIGRCAIVQDPWKNKYVILDMSKGSLETDSQGTIV